MNVSISVKPVGSRISKWGEGPIFWKDKLLYVDIEGHALIQLNPDTGEERVWEMGERIGTVVPTENDQFICAGDSGIYSFDPQTGQKENLADPEAGKRPDNRFNDGKCDPAGRLWAGTISTVKKTGDANLYMLDTLENLSVNIKPLKLFPGLPRNAWPKNSPFNFVKHPMREINGIYSPSLQRLAKRIYYLLVFVAGPFGSKR